MCRCHRCVLSNQNVCGALEPAKIKEVGYRIAPTGNYSHPESFVANLPLQDLKNGERIQMLIPLNYLPEFMRTDGTPLLERLLVEA